MKKPTAAELIEATSGESSPGEAKPRRPLHPLCELFPPIDGPAFDELVASIKEQGLQEPIVVVEGAILDGRNRYNACLAAGINPTFVPFRGDDPLRFVIAANIHRRHLTESQRAMIAAKIATQQHGGDRTSKQAANLPVDIPTQAEAAEMLNVSERSVRTARKVVEHAAPEDVAAINKGEATISGVEKKLKSTKPATRVTEVAGSAVETDECQKMLYDAVRGYVEYMTEATRQKFFAHIGATSPELDHRDEEIARLRARVAELEQGATARLINEPSGQGLPELTSVAQDQILNLVIKLLKTVDHPHEKKFHKYYVSNSQHGILLPSCSHHGWKNGGFPIDSTLLDTLWEAIKTSASCRISSPASPT